MTKIASLEPTHDWASNLLTLRKTSALRPVAWRHRLALRYISGQFVPADWIDSWTAETVRFQRALEACQSDANRLLLAEQMPEQYRAHQIHVSEPQSIRWELEARLLAGEPYAQIAQRFGLAPADVEWYERVYFNVSDCLDHRGYIVHVVIGPKLQYGLTPRDVDVIWKIYGYFGGVHVLQQVIDTFPAQARPQQAEEVESFLHQRNQSLLVCQASKAARMVAVNAETAPELLKQFDRQQSKAKLRPFQDLGESAASVVLPQESIAGTASQKPDPLAAQRIRLELKAAQALAIPLESERGRLRFLRLYQDYELARERLRHEERRLREREAETQRRARSAEVRLVKRREREMEKEAERARKQEEARAREFIAWQQRTRKQQERRSRLEASKMRAMDSPLTRLRWADEPQKQLGQVDSFTLGTACRPETPEGKARVRLLSKSLATTVHWSVRRRAIAKSLCRPSASSALEVSVS